jgi:hypothetical protein
MADLGGEPVVLHETVQIVRFMARIEMPRQHDGTHDWGLELDVDPSERLSQELVIEACIVGDKQAAREELVQGWGNRFEPGRLSEFSRARTAQAPALQDIPTGMYQRRPLKDFGPVSQDNAYLSDSIAAR